MYLILTFLALWTGIARAQFDIPTGMMMGMDPQQAMLMEMNSGGGTGGGMGADMGWGMGGGGGGGGGGGRRGVGNAGGSGGGMSDLMGGGGGGGTGGNMETMGSGGSSGIMENMNGGGGGGLPGNGMTNRQQNMGRFNMGGGGGGGGVGSNANNNNMGGNSAMMTMMLCRETPSRFGEMPCNVNNPSSCPMSQYLSCKSGVYFYPVCCAKDWRSLRIVDVMF